MNEDAHYPGAEQMEDLNAALDAIAEGRSYRPTLNGLIRGWRDLVEQIEAGYDWSIYEYFNDLQVRSMLQTVIDRAPALRAWIEAEVAPLDDRFRAATRARESDALLDRVPRFPGPELAGDLDDPGARTTLYRPVGDNELALIEQSGFTQFPDVSPISRSSISSFQRPTRSGSPANGTPATGDAATSHGSP